ncbi:bifunctional riboflavin kinase/FAD synthetase [Paenibacillus psychroresistens]|uniref:Riboflavin biosynthesis protein n=1 Tax=Paenibacillus psychroresistens TaxID=1778678 RepID=A0A6B8RL86_9BACL|nr:bifunctional riboflavin kinase/FAD synthetase [Paenibacillus psychroresistens]QGQ96275.1 bifunctional riboflavin kinase/FAD synthetase [Paenibacillus psychroresistens]
MQIIEVNYPSATFNELNTVKQVMALGDFDGIHLGHQEVIQRTTSAAKRLGLPASIMTFHPHPRVVLGQSKYEQNLTPLQDKMKLFEAMGIEYVYLMDFTLAFSRISPEEFVESVLVALGAVSVIVGFDFTFGSEGRGTPEGLELMGLGKFSVEIVPPFHLSGEKVSSTSIRENLLEGSIEAANELIGRTYLIRGQVVTGDGRGRTIGFPTANIEPAEDYVIPRKGVYAVRCNLHGKVYNAVMNIGTKPTFNENEVKITLEAHIFDFNQMIYMETIEVEFINYIRSERKFASKDELVQQINQDAAEAKRILS